MNCSFKITRIILILKLHSVEREEACELLIGKCEQNPIMANFQGHLQLVTEESHETYVHYFNLILHVFIPMCWNIRTKTFKIRQTHQIVLPKFRQHVSTLYGHLQA
jgi:hypothetical protein